MRDVKPSVGTGFSVSVLLLAAMLGTDARGEQRSAPWGEPACNHACEWWMSLGAKPVDHIPEPEPDPTLSIKALAPPNFSLLPKETVPRPSGRPTPPPQHDTLVDIRRGEVIAIMPPARPDDLIGASLWGVRIHGSAAVLPALFLQPH